MKKFILVFTIVLLVSLVSAAQILNDAGFEEDNPSGTFPSSGYWESSWFPVESGAVVTTTAAHSGNNGLWAYTAKAASTAWSGIYQEFNANTADNFEASAYIRTPPPSEWVDWVEGSFACIRIEFLDSSNNVISYKDSSKLTTGNTGWQQYSLTTGPATSGTKKVRLRFYIEKPESASARQSVANFDDAYLSKTESQPALYLYPYAVGIRKGISQEKFKIKNIGGGTLHFDLSENEGWLSLSQYSGDLNPSQEQEITVNGNRALCNGGTCSGTIYLSSNAGNEQIKAYLEMSETVPSLPSIVNIDKNRLIVRKRLLNGSLDAPLLYTIKGVAWTPTSIGTPADYTSRRNEFRKWYVADVQLLKEMNVNTVYTFFDFFANADGISILDYLYRNGIMVIMTADEDGTNNIANIDSIVPYYKNHPAILMWAIGNEWNINFYHGKFANLNAAAAATETTAQRIKALDNNHPVASVYGEIDIPDNNQPLSKTKDIVNNIAPSIDVWGLNIYRGDTFGTLFGQWSSITSKPMFLSEYGTDSYFSTSWWPVVGYESEAVQSGFNHKLWNEIKSSLFIYNNSNVCLGGTIFESSDEWWKVRLEDGGDISVHDNGGFETFWNPYAHPDGFGNEEYFGIIRIERKPKESYSQFRQDFLSVPNVYISAIDIQLKKGWNLISLPLIVSNMSVFSIFGKSLPIYAYNNSWFVPKKIDNKLGYWVKANQSANLTVFGTESNDNIELNTGWNLVGHPYLEEKDISELFDNSIVYAYNGSWSSYIPNRNFNSLKTLKPGLGYWVRK